MIAGLWIGSIYFYEHIWSTYFVREELSISAKSTVIKLGNGLLGVHLEMVITNNGSDPIFNALNGVTLYGFTVEKSNPISEDEFGKAVVSSINRDSSAPSYSRYGVISAPNLLSYAPFLVPAYQFQPRQTNTFQKYFVISNGWDFVEAQIEVLHSTKPLDSSPRYAYRDGKKIGIDLGFSSFNELRRSSITSAIPIKHNASVSK